LTHDLGPANYQRALYIHPKVPVPVPGRFNISFSPPRSHKPPHVTSLIIAPAIANMDTAIDLSDPAKALDLSNIRFQLMYFPEKILKWKQGLITDFLSITAVSKTLLFFTSLNESNFL
jgi:hypothetical protein